MTLYALLRCSIGEAEVDLVGGAYTGRSEHYVSPLLKLPKMGEGNFFV